MSDAVDTFRQAMESSRPPLGVKPRYLHEEQRLAELARAVHDYAAAGRPVLAVWTEEIEDLRASIEKHRPSPLQAPPGWQGPFGG